MEERLKKATDTITCHRAIHLWLGLAYLSACFEADKLVVQAVVAGLYLLAFAKGH